MIQAVMKNVISFDSHSSKSNLILIQFTSESFTSLPCSPARLSLLSVFVSVSVCVPPSVRPGSERLLCSLATRGVSAAASHTQILK